MGRTRKGLLLIGVVIAGVLPSVAALEDPAPAAAPIPAAAPTGRLVVDRAAGAGQDLWAFRADGTDPTRLTSLASGEAQPSLDRQATRLAFTSCRTNPLVGDLPCIVGSSTPAPVDLNVFVMTPGPEGDATRQITSNLADDVDPALAPNGDRVVFTSRRDGLNAQLYVAALNTDGAKVGEESRITASLLTDSSAPTWSPDGTRIAFVRNGRVQVLGMSVPEGGTNPAVTVTSGPTDDAPAWSPDGSRIAFVRGGDIWTVDASGEGPSRPALRVTTSASTDTDPAWSPDGSHIAYVSDRPTIGDAPGDFEVYVVAASGGPSTQLTANGLADRRPTWAEDVAIAADVDTVAASPAAVPVEQVPLQVGAPTIREAGLLDVPGIDLAPLDVPGIDLAGLLDVPGIDLAPLDVPGIDLAGLLDVPGIDLAPLASKVLDQISLAMVPLRSPLGGWDEVLTGTSFAGTPLQAVSLGDLRRRLAAEPLLAERLRALGPPDIDFSLSPLGNVSLSALLLGDTPFSALGTGIDLCGRLTTLGYRCSDLGPSPSALSLQLAGVALDDERAPLPIHLAALGGIDLLAGPAPLTQIRLTGLDLGTEFGDVRLVDIAAQQRDRVAACSAVDCSSSSPLTLLDVLRAGALRPTASIGDLGAAVGPLRLADLVLALIDSEEYPFAEVPFDRLGLDRYSGPTSTAIAYSASYAVVGRSVASGANVTLTLPGPSLVIPGSVTVDGRASEATIEDSATSTVVTVSLGDVVPGRVVRVGVRARPGTELRASAPTRLDVSSADVTEQRTGAPVAVGEAFEPNDTVATATPVSTGTLHVSHSSSPTDRDLFALPLEANRIYTARLAHSSVDRDLIAYATEPELRLRAGSESRPTILALADEGADIENVGDAVAPDPADDLDLVDGLTVTGLSANRGTSPEVVRIVAEAAGTAYLQVSPYLGAATAGPYTLTITSASLPPRPSCATRTFAFDAAPFDGADELAARGPTPTALDPSTRSLLLVNRGRLADSYGEAAAAEVMGKLATLAAHDRVRGQIVALDGDAAFLAADQSFVNDPCSVPAANAVVRAANDVVDRLRSGATADIDHVVVVGDDLQIPFARLRDRTITGNESAYAANIAAATGGSGNALLAAFAGGRILSDAPYGAFDPVPWLGAHLYLPGGDADRTVAVSRLLETPAEIVGQVDRFLAVGGALSLSKSLVAADDFMVDAGRAMDIALEGLIGAPQADLLTSVWSAADLLNRIFPTTGGAPSLIGLAAHADHTRLQSANGSTLSTTDLLARGSLSGRLLWAISCHLGTPVADLLVPGGSTTSRITDWAQAVGRGGGSVLIAQTGFGLGLQPGIGLTERLAVDFSKALRPGTSVGAAVEAARTAYLSGIGAYGVYDEKVLHQLTVYGLSMYGEGPNPPLPTPPASGDGVRTQTFAISPQYRLVSDSERGSSYEADNEPPLAVHNRPLQPSVRRSITAVQARGAMVRGIGGYFDRLRFDPVVASPALAGAGLAPEPAFGDMRFPSSPLQISPDGRTLVANLGVFRSSEPSGGRVTGLQRIYTQLTAEVGGPVDATNPDRLPPRILSVEASESATSATVSVEVVDRLPGGGVGSVAEAQIVLLDGSGAWRVLPLAASGANIWSATFPYRTGYEFMVQARDAAWNVGRSTSKAGNFRGESGPPPPDGSGVYRFVGPHSPGSFKDFNAGSTIPVKFEVFRGSTEVTNPRVVRAIWFVRTPCPGEGPVTDTADAGNPADIFFDGDRLHYGWKTDPSWLGTCRALQLELDDGSSHRIHYSLK